jgi:hypothetical protein
MYLLARYLRCDRLVATWAAIVFIIFPWHFARAEHASLTHLEVLVLLVMALVAVTRAPTLFRFGLVGAAVLACWLTSGYFGGMAVISVIAFSVGAALVNRRRRALVAAAGATGAAVLASGLVAVGSYVSGANAGAGIKREADALAPYGMRPLELVFPPPRSLLFHLDAFWERHRHGSPNFTEITGYLGLVTIALAVVWLVVVWRRRNGYATVTSGLVATFVVGFLFALPSPVAGISMPSKLLWDVLPAFRVPSRWDPLLMTAVLPLAALGLQSVRRAVGVVAVAVAIALSAVELSTHRVAHFRTVPVPPEYTALERGTPNGIVAEYPLGYSDLYRLWQRIHGRPLVNGAPDGSLADQVRFMILDPRQPGTAETLALLGVTSVVIHPGGPADTPLQPREPTGAEGYRLVGRFPDRSTVWAVTAEPATAVVTLPGGFSPPRLVDGSVGYPLSAPSGVALMELRAKSAGVVRLVFDATAPSKVSELRIQDAQGEHPFPLTQRTHFDVNVEVPRGVSQLLFKVDPPATSDDDAVVLSQPRAETASGAAQLHAIPSSPDPGF